MEIDLDGVTRGSPLAGRDQPSARCARTSTSSSTTPSSRSGGTPPIRWTRRSTSGRTGRQERERSTRRSGFSPSRATSSPASRSAAELDRSERGLRRDARRPPSLAQAGPRRGAAPALVRGVPASAAGRAARSASTRRARPAPPASTSAPGMRVYRDTVFLERPCGGGCRREPPARPLSGLPHADGGRGRPRVPVPLVRPRVPRRPRPRPRAWGDGGETMAEAAHLELPYPEASVIEADSLAEQTSCSPPSCPTARSCSAAAAARTSVRSRRSRPARSASPSSGSTPTAT